MEIKIRVINDKIKTTTKGDPNVDQFMSLIFTSVLSTMNQVLQATPEEHKEKVKHFLYDTLNESASATLAMFAPDNELRPDLTFEAIKELENKKMQQYIDKAKQYGALDA